MSLVAITGVAGLGNVFTHFSLAPTIWVTSRNVKRYFVFIIIVLFMYFASMEAHICEVFYGYGCPIDISWLWFTDNIGAEGLLLSTVSITLKLSNLEKEIATQLILIIVLVFYKTMTSTMYYSGAVTTAFIVYGFVVNSYRLRYYIPGIICAIGGLGVFFFLGFDDFREKYYFSLHPVWHVLIFGAIPLIILGCEDGIPEEEALFPMMEITALTRAKKAWNRERKYLKFHQHPPSNFSVYESEDEDRDSPSYLESMHALEKWNSEWGNDINYGSFDPSFTAVDMPVENRA